jgi:hypothetical protein
LIASTDSSCEASSAKRFAKADVFATSFPYAQHVPQHKANYGSNSIVATTPEIWRAIGGPGFLTSKTDHSGGGRLRIIRRRAPQPQAQASQYTFSAWTCAQPAILNSGKLAALW